MACSSIDSHTHPSPNSVQSTADDPLLGAGRARRTPTPEPEPAPKLVLDLKSVADVEGLAEEVAVLRASIRQLAQNGDMAVHVKVLAELRHQIETLGRTLKTQQSLEEHDGGARAAELTRVLEELGDELGVSR